MIKYIKEKFPTLLFFKEAYNSLIRQYVLPRRKSFWGYRADTALVRVPINCSNPKNVFFEEGCRLSPNALILNHTGKVTLKERTGISFGLTVITGNHTPTVGIPVTISNPLHINDKETDIVIEEDSWIGVNATLISGAHIGRGAIIGACALVNRTIPPYAVAVGVPAKIIGVKFGLEQIIRHEEILYPVEKRMKRAELEILFMTVFFGKKVIGTDELSDTGKEEISNYQTPHYL